MADTTEQHIAARDDVDLRARLIASAEQAGIPQAENFVQGNLGKLVSATVDGTTTLTSVHAYAKGQRDAALALIAPSPGANPAAITDVHIAAAIAVVWGTPATTPSAP